MANRYDDFEDRMIDDGHELASDEYGGAEIGKTRIVVKFGYDALRDMGYPIMVEMWDRVMGSGMKKRKYKAEFTEAERKTIGRYHTIFYAWHLRTGTPREHEMKISTYKLLQRAISFFASQ